MFAFVSHELLEGQLTLVFRPSPTTTMGFRKLFLVRRPAVAFIIFAVAILTTILSFSLLMKKNVNNYSKLQSLTIHESIGLSSTRVCCLILTSPKNLVSRAKPIHETWGSRCDRHFFITEPFSGNVTSEERNMTQYLPIAPIEGIIEGYDHLTQKSNFAFLFAHENLRDECGWFVKADDDTYLIIENLKWFLSERNESEPVTFGYNFKVRDRISANYSHDFCRTEVLFFA